MIEDMKIGDVMRLVQCLGGGATAARAVDHGMAVVVLDRGFVYVGRTTTDGEFCTIAEARNVRRWGTTKGLGQLVLDGPQANTQIDKVGTTKAPMRAVISIHPTREELWSKS